MGFIEENPVIEGTMQLLKNTVIKEKMDHGGYFLAGVAFGGRGPSRCLS